MLKISLRLKLRLPKIYSEIVEELVNLAEFPGAQTLCLDIFQQLPEDLRPEIIRELVSFKKSEFIPFLQLVYQEAQGEIREEARKALVKLKYLGYNLETPTIFRTKGQEPVMAYASPSRLSGNCVLVLIARDGREYIAHYFTVYFNHLGVKEYFQHRSAKREEIMDAMKDKGLVPLTFVQGQGLLQDAYQQNIRFGTKVATGASQFEHFLKEEQGEKVDYQQLLRKIGGKDLSIKKVINSYLLALKNIDGALMYDLATPLLQKEFGPRQNFIESWHHPLEKHTFIKTIIKSTKGGEREVKALISLVTSDEKDDLQRVELELDLIKENNTYLLARAEIKGISPIPSNDPLSPLNHKVYACVYKIQCGQQLLQALDEHDFLHLTGEFEGGVCYKWFKKCDPLEYGIDLAKNVYGEFIITQGEMIVFSSNLRSLTEISLFLQTNPEENHIQLTSKTLCTIREIYRVITEQVELGEELGQRHHTYIIPLPSLLSWHQFCSSNSKSMFECSGHKVFHLTTKRLTFEVIFYKNYGIINLFHTTLPELERQIKLPAGEIYCINEILSSDVSENSWSMLKLLKSLKDDPLAKIYLPLTASTKDIASRLQLVIT